MKKLIISSLFVIFATESHAGDYSFTAKWKIQPKVSVCYEGIDIELVEKALSFWEKELSVSIPPARYETCKISPPWGYVYIDINDSRILPKENGFTERVFTGDLNLMKSADVIIRSDLVHEQLLITHELGHALGLSHSEDPRNIMYPIQIFDHFALTSSQ